MSRISYENKHIKQRVNLNNLVRKYSDSYSEKQLIKIVSKAGPNTIININEYDWELFYSPKNEQVKIIYEEIGDDFDGELNGKIDWSMRKK